MARKSPTRKASANDAIAMLIDDHKRVQKLVKEFEKAHEQEDMESCRQIAQTVCMELEAHAALEEELFYPAAREALEDEDLIEEAEVEHQSAKELIAKLKELDPNDPKYAATFTVLGEYVNHHVKEEEGQIFKEVKKAKMDLESLGEQMRNRREDLMAEEQSADEEAENMSAQSGSASGQIKPPEADESQADDLNTGRTEDSNAGEDIETARAIPQYRGEGS